MAMYLKLPVEWFEKPVAEDIFDSPECSLEHLNVWTLWRVVPMSAIANDEMELSNGPSSVSSAALRLRSGMGR